MDKYSDLTFSSYRFDLLKDTIDELVFAKGLIETPDVVLYYACLNCGYIVEKLPSIEIVALRNYAEICLSQV